MNEKIAHLNPYKFEDNDKFSPYKCCDIKIDIKPCDDNCCSKKNEEQDKAIDQVNGALKLVGDEINKNRQGIIANASAISALSEIVSGNSDAIDSVITKNEEQDRRIDLLSASTPSYSDMNALQSAITDSLKDEFYTKCAADEKFTTFQYVDFNLTSINQAISQHEQRLDSVEANKADKTTVNEAFSALTDVVSGNTALIEQLDEKKVDKSVFSAYTDATDSAIDDLNNRVSANTNHLDTLSGDTVDKTTFSGAVSSITSSITNVYNIASANSDSISAISGDVSAISAHVHTIDETIGEGVFSSTTNGNISYKFTELSSKTDNEISTRTAETTKLKSDVGKLSGDVISYKEYIQQISNDKADKTDLSALSGTVINLTTTVSTKANQSDLEASNARISTNESDINDLKLNKQDKGNYVSATTLDNYYTKEQTSAATAIQEALNGKQDAGNYVSATTLNDYYKKSETIDLVSYNEFTANTNTELDKRAGKDALAQLTNRVTATESVANTATSDLNNFKYEVSATYETKKNVANDIKDVKDSILQNTTNISKISELANLKKYDPNTGEFDNSGNGILDVLHKEFHNLISGYSEDDLVGLIKKLDEKITKLENK